MATESTPKLQIAYSLMMDIVGWSQLGIEDQTWYVEQLTAAVRNTPEFQRAKAANQLLYKSTGDGMALVFFDDMEAPVRCAINTARILKRIPSIQVRMGIHTGPIQRVDTISNPDDVAGGGISLAERVMSCAQGGHILLSGSMAEMLIQLNAWKSALTDLGEHEVKHGARIRLYNLMTEGVGSAEPIATAIAVLEAHQETSSAQRVILLYKCHAQPDEYVLKMLASQLSTRGCDVFFDRHLTIGSSWLTEIQQRIRDADAVIPLLSATAISSEILAMEIHMAHEAREEQEGRPRLLPVRLGYEGPVSEEYSHILDPIQYKLWRSPEDDANLVAELVRGLHAHPDSLLSARAAAEAETETTEDLEPVGGPVPPGSRFYVARDTDRQFLAAVGRRESIILIKGPRQIGKTSLLARGFQQARETGARVVMTDFQKLNREDLATPKSLYLALARLMSRQLALNTKLDDTWDPKASPNTNFEDFLLDQVFSEVTVPIIWGLDEVDRLFDRDYGSEVFGLFRAWYNERQLNASGPWSRLCQVISYATEAHLFITDPNQSPFNVGLQLQLKDFTPDQVADLNRRYGSPLETSQAVERFLALVGGHPYLVRRGLYTMRNLECDVEAFIREADQDDGPFDDHLHRIVVLLARSSEQSSTVRELLEGQPCPSKDAFFRLRSAGVVSGDAHQNARLRCELYANYLHRHLP